MCDREIICGCYETRIKNIVVFNYIKRYLRYSELNRLQKTSSNSKRQSKRKQFTTNQVTNSFKLFFVYASSAIVSLCHILKLLFNRKQIDNLVFAFCRVDKLNGTFMDKFTDPLIDYSKLGESYIIFDKGKQGKHNHPRKHSDRVYYTDGIQITAKIISIIGTSIFFKLYEENFNNLYLSITKAYPKTPFTKKTIIRIVFFYYLQTLIYYKVLKFLGIRKLFAPSRADFLPIIPSAKLLGIKVYELQHGISYGETITYSGFRDPMFTPDYFLAFGKLSPSNVYGINEDRIIEIGFAFYELFRNDHIVQKHHDANDILVVSDPHITSLLLSTCLYFAQQFTTVNFYFRPHPMETLRPEQMQIIDKTDNIFLDDNSQNILQTIMSFDSIIGESSTALYEALAMRKKVGLLFMPGLSPRYLEDSDKKCFWEICDFNSFRKFLEGKIEDKAIKSIYSNFNKTKFNQLLST